MSLVQIMKTVSTAGTAEALSTEDLWVDQVTFQGLVQTGEVYVGDSNVAAAAFGFKLPPTTGDNVPPTVTYRGKINLKNVYVDVETSTQGVAVSYIPSTTNSRY